MVRSVENRKIADSLYCYDIQTKHFKIYLEKNTNSHQNPNSMNAKLFPMKHYLIGFHFLVCLLKMTFCELENLNKIAII